MKKIAAASVLALALIASGCYNDPETSDRIPGQGNAGDSSRGPSVGPGTIPGGSTAGPQPAAKPEEEHAAAGPEHSGESPAQEGAKKH
jgi:hypothetical protein